MQGAVREIALDVVRVDGSVLPCLLNAVELRDDDGAPLLVRATLFEATARRRYERELLAAQRAAEESRGPLADVQQVVSELAGATTVADVASVVVERGRRGDAGAGGGAGAGRGRPADRGRRARPAPGRASSGLPDGAARELEEAARGRLALELAEGVRTVPLDDRLRARGPAWRGDGGGRADRPGGRAGARPTATIWACWCWAWGRRRAT